MQFLLFYFCSHLPFSFLTRGVLKKPNTFKASVFSIHLAFETAAGLEIKTHTRAHTNTQSPSGWSGRWNKPLRLFPGETDLQELQHKTHDNQHSDSSARLKGSPPANFILKHALQLPLPSASPALPSSSSWVTTAGQLMPLPPLLLPTSHPLLAERSMHSAQATKHPANIQASEQR